MGICTLSAYSVHIFCKLSVRVKGRSSRITRSYTRCRNRVTCHPIHLRHTHHKTTDNIPTFKSLCAELHRAARQGHQQCEVLDILHTMETLNYPIDSNIICKLLTISSKFNNKEMFTKVLGLIDKHVPYDVQVYTSVINGLLVFSEFVDAVRVYSEMIGKGITPRQHLIYNMFGESVKRDDMENAVLFFEQMVAQYFPLPLTSTEGFITMCLNHRRHEQLVKLLEFYSTFNLPLGDMLNQLACYFDSYRNSPSSDKCWQSVLTTVNKNGICSNCHAQLTSYSLSDQHLKELHSHVDRELTRAIAGASSRVNIGSLNRLIDSRGPFHYVIDGLNVACHGDASLSFNKILKLRGRLNSEGNVKILVIGSRILYKDLTTINGRRVDYHEAIKHYSERGLYFFVKLGSSLSDLALMHATLQSGPHTRMVSNDQFRNHVYMISSTETTNLRIRLLLKKWLLTTQVKMLGKDLVYPPAFLSTVHMNTEEDHYHIPTSSEQWLCVRRTSQ